MAGRPKIKASNITPSIPNNFANGSKKLEKWVSNVKSPIVIFLVGPYNTGSNWTRVQPLKYYPGKTCACGISYNSFSTDVSIIANIRSIGKFVNEEYFIDVESLLSMSSKELERYGISDEKVAKFNELIKSDEEIYNIYNDKLEMLIQSN